jgi:hypothetical protein
MGRPYTVTVSVVHRVVQAAQKASRGPPERVQDFLFLLPEEACPSRAKSPGVTYTLPGDSWLTDNQHESVTNSVVARGYATQLRR